MVSDKAWKKSPQIAHQLQNAKEIETTVLNHRAVVAGLQPRLRGIQAIITASESTAGAHKGPHTLTKRANRQGIATYTLQHGFENVGLTYFDADYPVGKIKFASKTIFTWGETAQLPPEIPSETRAKCVAVGCPKATYPPNHTLPIPGHNSRDRLIAIFENLHWSRYSDRYRQTFLQDLHKTAAAHPKTTFVIKPHPTGLWLTQGYPDNLQTLSNLQVANPQDPTWAAFNAATLIAMADITITTPSTIALDAARAGCPVAVVAYDLSLANFEPLTLLRQSSDWQALVGRKDTQPLKERAQGFARKRLIPGNAIERIISQISSDRAN